MKNVNTTFDLFIEQLKEQYSAERLQLEALPKLRAQVSSNEVLKIIDHHIGLTKKQMTRLDGVFSTLNRNLHGEINTSTQGIINEAFELADRCTTTSLKDISIVVSIQHLNHHNIASYRSLVLLSEGLGLKEIREILSESLSEEKITDNTLEVQNWIRFSLNGIGSNGKLSK